MNSCRCKHNCCHTAIHACENKSYKRSSGSHHSKRGLLRLNSTGEVSSVSQVPNCQNWHEINHDGVKLGEKQSYKNLVENLRMGSLINSASACLDTASSYICNLCPYKTAKGLTRTHSEGSSLSYVKDMISGFGQSYKNNSLSAPEMTNDFEHLLSSCNCAKDSKGMGKSMNWTGNIFGALQSSFLTNCKAKSEKMKGVNTEKYVPPQRRYLNEKINNVSSAVDPKLTPYNAKLLEKSKKSYSCADAKKGNFTKKNQCDDKADNMGSLQLHPQNCSIEKSAQKYSHFKDREINNDSACKESNLEQDNISSGIQKETMQTETKSESEKDWFDYECVSAKCIPISIDKLQLSSQKFEENNMIDQRSASPQLHSWFSIENGNETAKIDSSLTKDSVNICDKKQISGCLERESSPEAESKCDIGNKQLEMNDLKQRNKQTSVSSCDSKLQQDKIKTDHSKSDSKSYVLYVRSIGRRGKPSAKKRRRQKAQQNEINDKSTCQNLSSSVKPNSAVHGNNAVAFILGYSGDRSETDSHSFHVSCDIDNESDWSDSDFESDETCSSIEDENMFDSGLGFQSNNPLLGMQCIQLTCTLQPPEESIHSPNSSDIDNINLLWKVQVSVKPENTKKKSSTCKKVHFAEDDLTTVHPMVAWSHAYQAARKGPWEQYARDRERFRRRITESDKSLESILNKTHRDKIYAERFVDT